MGTFLISKMCLNVITVKLFLKNLCSGTHHGGFQFLLNLDLWGLSFHAVVVFGLGKKLLFKSVLGHCGYALKIKLYHTITFCINWCTMVPKCKLKLCRAC